MVHEPWYNLLIERRIMKRIILIIIASFVFCNVGYSDIKIMEEKTIGKTEIKTLCIDGRKFVLASSENGESITPAFDYGGTSVNRYMILPEFCS